MGVGVDGMGWGKLWALMWKAGLLFPHTHMFTHVLLVHACKCIQRGGAWLDCSQRLELLPGEGAQQSCIQSIHARVQTHCTACVHACRGAIQETAAAANGPQVAASVIAIKERDERRKQLKVCACIFACVRGSCQYAYMDVGVSV